MISSCEMASADLRPATILFTFFQEEVLCRAVPSGQCFNQMIMYKAIEKANRVERLAESGARRVVVDLT